MPISKATCKKLEELLERMNTASTNMFNKSMKIKETDHDLAVDYQLYSGKIDGFHTDVENIYKKYCKTE